MVVDAPTAGELRGIVADRVMGVLDGDDLWEVVTRLGQATRQVNHVLGQLDRAQQIGRVRALHLEGVGCVPPQRRHLHELINGRSMSRIDLQQGRYNISEVVAVLRRYPRVLPPEDLSVEALHVLCPKRRAERHHLVKNTAERPHVALGVVGHIPPDLGGGIVRGPGLRHAEASLCHLGDVEVPELCYHAVLLVVKEYVRALHVPVEDPHVVQGLEARAHAVEVPPDVDLFEVRPLLLALCDLVHEVATVRALRDYAEATRLVVEEGLLVRYDIFVLHGGKKANLIECVLLLLVRQRRQLHLLQCIDLPICQALHLVDSGVGALSKQRHLLEVIQTHRRARVELLRHFVW
mmetsp:Transcript_17715/g.48192  ORF Transcript_17715/g.48192 Transcript_17715/m.48192 type:complete len:350 (+) Transcript_17715:561-1610(+)